MPVEPSFEQALSRLEEIVDTIESGQTTLETSMTLYKEGIALAVHCNDILTTYEAEVVTLQKNTEGVFTLTPYRE